MGRRRRRGAGRDVAEDEEAEEDGFRSRPLTNKELQHGAGLGCRAMYGLAAMQGWRAAMEDAHIALPDFDTDRGLSLFGVFDGHGGAAVAQVVAERLPGLLRSRPAYGSHKYAEAFRQAFASLEDVLRSPSGQREVSRRSRGDTAWCMGCTAVVVLIVAAANDIAAKPAACWPRTASADAELLVVNLGDSRCVLASGGSSVIAMSEDHTPKLPNERLRIKRAGGFVNKEGRINGNLNLSRALGDFIYKRNQRLKPEEQLISGVPEIRRRKLTSADRYLILGCDGIFERMSNEAIVRNLSAELEAKGGQQSGPRALSLACGILLDKLISKNPVKTQGLGCDNMTVILVNLHGCRTAKQLDLENIPTLRKLPAAEMEAATGNDAANRIDGMEGSLPKRERKGLAAAFRSASAAASSPPSANTSHVASGPPPRNRRQRNHFSASALTVGRGRSRYRRHAVLRAQTWAARQRRRAALLTHPSIC